MREDLDVLLDLAVDVEVLGDSLADVDLTSPEDEDLSKELAAKDLLQPGEAGGPGGAAEPSSQCGPAAQAPVATVGSTSDTTSSVEMSMSALQNTTWDKDVGSEDTTEVRSFPFFFAFSYFLRYGGFNFDVQCSMFNVEHLNTLSFISLFPDSCLPVTNYVLLTSCSFDCIIHTSSK